MLKLTTIAPNTFPRVGTNATAAIFNGKATRLSTNDTTEVLTFLRERPVHTVVMSSFINDNGIESELNRGIFYGYRGNGGKLEGVALIGHTTLVEARTSDALMALAASARRSKTP